ncbi:hypothetical protein OLZ33_00615 [Pantoea ananatis]|uniref:hypothetical protein n=1 Tax=Pantoea ananas TaxID=553 RepID=UPI0015895169|nr:hypothetical protein [Pantoea ananatis]MBA4820173.1 hypothetical protein [Pantoea ananatis]MCW1830503.1 hypothetical protein [Pantoea ananatis]QKV90084.1 hypothetical protein FOB88_24605 [Pantoea ananatis]
MINSNLFYVENKLSLEKKTNQAYTDNQENTSKVGKLQVTRNRQEAEKKNMRFADERTNRLCRTGAGERFSQNHTSLVSEEEGGLFTRLLNDEEDEIVPLLHEFPSFQQPVTRREEYENKSAPHVPFTWDELDSDIEQLIQTVPYNECKFSIELPCLGAVDVNFKQTHDNGLDISLGLQEQAYKALNPFREKCRLSLDKKLGKSVRLNLTQKIQVC